MRRPALYSSSRPARTAAASPEAPGSSPTPVSAEPAAAAPRRRFAATGPRLQWIAILLLGAALAASLVLHPAQRRLTQEDINAAVLKTMETKVMPSEYARAYENVRPSVVRVVSYVKKSRLRDEDQKMLSRMPKGAKPKPLGPAPSDPAGDVDGDEVENGVGTGVVIIDKGVILTNLHVVNGADHVKVIFYDGLEAQATVTACRPRTTWPSCRPARSPTT